ncbi:radical SAM family heme chaperone HemW [Caldithrix abyssi]
MNGEKANVSFNPGIYLHIPFCEHKCGYCDFYSITNRSQQALFVEALCQEMEQAAEQIRPAETFDTIYFGGGTPSLLQPDQLQRILSVIHRVFAISSDCEITLEMNPGATEKEKLPVFKQLGVNRLSIGVQSFDDRELKLLERIHSARQAVETFEAARKAGFTNLGIDLIYALPGQSLNSWRATLQQAVHLAPEHISAYNLIFEPGTPFDELREKGQLNPQEEEEELRFFNFTHQFLSERGFLHYEVSNFARAASLYSRHNYKYWLHAAYLGFGPSAHSFWNDRRWGNVRSLNAYLQQLKQQRLPRAFEEQLSAQTKEFEHIFLRLRTYEGINLAYFEKTFHRSFLETYRKTINTLIDRDFAVIDAQVFRLTQKGMAVCDEILQYFA